MGDGGMLPQTRQGGTSSFKRGSLKRRLPSQTFAKLVAGASGGTETSASFKLTGLNGDLNIQIAAGFIGPDGQVIDPALVQAGGVTMQLTPVNNFGDNQKMLLRPVFQDPAGPPGANTPLPQDLPFGWEFSTEADEVWIDFVINTDWGLITAIPDGNVVIQVTIEYNGAWWDTTALQFALGQVQLTQGRDPIVIGTPGV